MKMKIALLFVIQYVVCSIQQTNWQNCSVDELNSGDIQVQCMFVDVPIDWNENSNSETIKIFIKRYFLSEMENRSHHLWRIPGEILILSKELNFLFSDSKKGGGGIPVSSLESEALQIVSQTNGKVSVYVTDKRGVGQSSHLECPISVFQNFSACLSYIKQNQYRLKHNTVTNMARDLYNVLKIASNRKNLSSHQRIILMGSSQGTYVLQRYLHLIKDEQQIDGVILDSVVPTDYIDLIKYDQNLDYIFLDLFVRCAQDRNHCANRFENDNPMQALYTYKINENLRGNLSCLAMLKTNSREIGMRMSYLFSPLIMQIFPALIYRINRCNAKDQIVLRHFLNQISLTFPYNRPGYSMLVALNNDLTELWSLKNASNIELSCDYIKGMSDNTFIAMQLMSDTYCPIYQRRVLHYSTDEYYTKYPKLKYPIPILVLHGDMDSSLPLPIARHFYKKYAELNTNITLIELPRTGHTAIDASPMLNEQMTCGWLLALSFISSPTFEPDRSCLEKILPIDFAGLTENSKQISKLVFGTESFWD